MTAADIERLEQARRKAMLAGDADALSDLLDEGMTWVHASSNVDDKLAFLQGFRSGKLKCFRLDHSQVAVSHWAGGAMVTGIVDMVVAVDEVRRAQHSRFTAIWIQTERGPRLARWHSTKMPLETEGAPSD